MKRTGALLFLIVLTGAAVIGYVAANQTGLPDEPTGYDYSTPSPTPAATSTAPVSFDGEPIEQTFRFDQGSAYPSDWSWPIRVEFRRPDDGNWTDAHVFNVDRLEWVTVELLGEEHYQIVVEDADGDRRTLGIYVPKKPGVNRTVVIGGCCVDDFSTEKTNKGDADGQ